MSERWPLHPVPREDDFLSDWVRRIAKSYGMTYRVFCLRVLKLDDNGIMYLDDDPSDPALEILSKGTGQPIEVLRGMTMPARCRQIRDAADREEPEILALYTKIARYFGKEGQWLLKYV